MHFRLFQRLLVVVIFATQAAMVNAQDAIDLAWDWAPGDSGYTSGPNGDIVYDIYMRKADDADYAWDYPAINGIDNCRWEIDHYTCETTLVYAFESDKVYHLVCVSYLADDPTQRSLSSNEISYRVEGADPVDPDNEHSTTSSGGGGGGCFLSIGLSGGRTANP